MFWQLQHGGARGGYDMNVINCWKRGYSGKGVVISILDDGIQRDHPELALNYVSTSHGWVNAYHPPRSILFLTTSLLSPSLSRIRTQVSTSTIRTQIRCLRIMGITSMALGVLGRCLLSLTMTFVVLASHSTLPLEVRRYRNLIFFFFLSS